MYELFFFLKKGWNWNNSLKILVDRHPPTKGVF